MDRSRDFDQKPSESEKNSDQLRRKSPRKSFIIEDIERSQTLRQDRKLGTRTPVNPWTPEEDQNLLRAVQSSSHKDWTVIAQSLPGRTGKQCWHRFHYHLRHQFRTGDWTQEEDDIIMQQQAIIGNRWSQIAQLLPGRSENSVKNRWHSRLRHRHTHPSESQPTADAEASQTSRSADSFLARGGSASASCRADSDAFSTSLAGTCALASAGKAFTSFPAGSWVPEIELARQRLASTEAVDGVPNMGQESAAPAGYGPEPIPGRWSASHWSPPTIRATSESGAVGLIGSGGGGGIGIDGARESSILPRSPGSPGRHTRHCVLLRRLLGQSRCPSQVEQARRPRRRASAGGGSRTAWSAPHAATAAAAAAETAADGPGHLMREATRTVAGSRGALSLPDSELPVGVTGAVIPAASARPLFDWIHGDSDPPPSGRREAGRPENDSDWWDRLSPLPAGVAESALMDLDAALSESRAMPPSGSPAAAGPESRESED